MGEFESPLARADRPRAWRRPRRGIVLTIAAAGVLTILGSYDGGEQLRRVSGRVSVPLAEAASERRPADAPEDRPILVRTEIIRLSQAADIGPTPLRGIDAATPAPAAAPAEAEARPAEDQPIVTAQRAVPQPLFEKRSLSGDGPAGNAMPDMALRASTDAALPLDGLGAEIAAQAPPSAARATPLGREPAVRITGIWAGSAAACGRRNSAYLPLVIDGRGARAGGSSCAFGRTRQTGNRWAIAATCRSGAESWAANVKLIVDGRRLTWSSERGTETYTRCR